MPCFIVDVYARCAGSRVWQSDLFYWSLQGKPEKQEPKRRTTKQSDGPTTGTGRTTEQTDRAIFNDIKAGQDGVKQPAARNASATGLIAAFRPVEQLPASSAVASSLASSAGSNASDRQAADDLLDLRFYVDALLLRAKVLRLELPAHRPEDAYEKDSAGTSVSQHLPCCCSANCAILCPLLSIPASSWTLWYYSPIQTLS